MVAVVLVVWAVFVISPPEWWDIWEDGVFGTIQGACDNRVVDELQDVKEESLYLPFLAHWVAVYENKRIHY